MIEQEYYRSIDPNARNVSSGTRSDDRHDIAENTAAVYITAEDYLFSSAVPLNLHATNELNDLAKSLAGQMSRTALVRVLSAMNHFAHHPDTAGPWPETFRSMLTAETRGRFDIAMNPSGDAPPLFLNRQSVLRALKLAFTQSNADLGEPVEPTTIMFQATLLCHLLSSILSRDLPDYDPNASYENNVPNELRMYFLQNQMFNRDRDWYLELATHAHLWEDRLDVAIKPYNLTPLGLAETILGISPLDALALGFGLYTHARTRSFESPGGIDRKFNSAMEQDRIDAFVGLFAGSYDLHETLAGQPSRSSWDFLNFQQKPILVDGEALIVLDETYLFDALLHGLYWRVHDHEKFNHGDSARDRWANAYARHFELVSEDLLRATSPLLLENPPRRAFYDENEFPYPGPGQVCDATIELGNAYVLVEIVSGRPTTATRIDGNVDAFQQDVEKLVISKAKQLEASAQKILTNWCRSAMAGEPYWIIPAIVVGDEFPHSILSYDLVEKLLEEKELLQDGRIGPLALLDILDLQLLVGLSEEAEPPWHHVLTWRTTQWKHYSFAGYLRLTDHDLYQRASRPSGVRDRAQRLLDEFVRRLDLLS